MNKNSIRIIRKMNDLTQKEMAKKMGIAKSTYAQKEQGAIAWTLSDFIFFKVNYNVNISNLDEFIKIEEDIINRK